MKTIAILFLCGWAVAPTVSADVVTYEAFGAVGDGSAWTPAITVKGGSSGFYSVHVTK